MCEEAEEYFAKKLKENEGDFIGDLISNNPGIMKSINRIFMKQSIKMGIILSMLISGVFSLLTATTILFKLTYEAWLVSGIVMTGLGAFFTLRAYIKR